MNFHNYMKTVISGIKEWVYTAIRKSEMTNDDAFNLLAELSVVEPVTNENGAVFTDENGAIFVL